MGSAPLGGWQTTTFVAGLRHHRLTAPMVVDGPMDGELFLAWVEQFLCPTLQTGDMVILDNLSSHKVDGVQQAITAVGARALLFTALFARSESHRKALFKTQRHCSARAAQRSTEELWQEIGEVLNTVTSSECANYFASSGYVGT